jgi:NADPH:quinone reductase-like Zn-dependent oxidoreductase
LLLIACRLSEATGPENNKSEPGTSLNKQPTNPFTLKAIIHTEYGDADVLRLTEVEKPKPVDNQLLVKVFAVSINDWDWGLFKGNTFVNRLMYGLFKPKKQILGSDIAGRVEAVGKSVTRFKPGDEVFGDLSGQWGGFAEYVCVNETAVGLKSPQMTFEQAAAIPQAAMLAVQGLVDVGNIQHGQKLLINGAGGGVGTFAIQIAKLYGAEVTVVESENKLGLLRSMGASYVIDYKKQDFTMNGQTYDLILDVKTDRSIFNYLRVLKPGGTYVTVGGSMGRILQAFALGRWISLFNKKNVKVVMLKPNKDLAYINQLFEDGKLTPVIDRLYSLEQVPKAFVFFESAAHKGKLVISVNTDK